ncbi:MAG TPA: DUF5666 domain-containing protein [Chthoniobacterales bacterium]|jgi:hypothetical protein
MKIKLPITAALCVAAFIIGSPFGVSAKGKKTTMATPEGSASPAMAKPHAIPFRGKVMSVDGSTKTFMVGKRTFTVTAQTQITKDGAAATISDLMTDEKVSGSYYKKDGGTLEAKTVKIGAKMETPSKAMTGAEKDKAAATKPTP